ncbi:MAG: hypothetical protein V4644_00340 [Patescibacteria group bacterium]
MINDSITFSRNLAKGRIAETLFEQMLRDAGCFTILAFGYESVLPELAHRQHDMRVEETMEIIRRAPDFAVINNDTHDVHLIEVKYMMNARSERVLAAANRMFESWKPSYLFISTPHGFFFDKVSTIVQNKGHIPQLTHAKIPPELQKKYTDLLNELIVPKEFKT